MNDGDQHQPQAGRPAIRPGQMAQDHGEPDFGHFHPALKDALLPRWLHLGLLWIFGLGTLAALALGGVFVVRQRKADQVLAVVAVTSRAPLQIPLPLAAPAAGQATPAQAPAAIALPTAAPQTKPPEMAVSNDRLPARVAESADASATPAAAPRPATPVAKTKRPKPKSVAALARRKAAIAQRRRDASSIARLNAAVAQCRAQARAPGECNIRACDVLGNAHPACR